MGWKGSGERARGMGRDRMWLAFEHEVLRDESREGVMERDLGQVLAVPEDRLMQVTTSGVFWQGNGRQEGLWGGMVQASVSLGGAPR